MIDDNFCKVLMAACKSYKTYIEMGYEVDTLDLYNWMLNYFSKVNDTDMINIYFKQQWIPKDTKDCDVYSLISYFNGQQHKLNKVLNLSKNTPLNKSLEVAIERLKNVPE